MHNIAMIFLHVIIWLYGSIIELHFMINILWKHHLNFLLVTNRSGDNLPLGKKKNGTWHVSVAKEHLSNF